MFKILSFSIIVLAFGALGIIKSQSYKQRVDELNDIRDMLQLLNSEISYRKDPLPVIFKRISAQKNSISSTIMMHCCDLMDEKLDMQTCWQNAVEMACSNSSLTAEDKIVIHDLGMQLGKSHIKGQEDLLKLTEEKIMLQITKAIKEHDSKGKMYRGLGFSTGLVIAVLLI